MRSSRLGSTRPSDLFMRVAWRLATVHHSLVAYTSSRTAVSSTSSEKTQRLLDQFGGRGLGASACAPGIGAGLPSDCGGDGCLR